MMKQGKKFEELTAEIFGHLKNAQGFETVEHNVFLDGSDGPRQIDVLLTGKVGPINIVTIVECKDYNKTVDVTEVDALHSKMQDVRANKAVLVARKGFSKTATRKAKRIGISLCTAHSVADEKWKFNLEVPFVIVEMSAETYQPSFIFTAIENQTGIDFANICGTPLHRAVAEYWNEKEIECNDGVTEHVIIPNIPQPWWTTIQDGRKIDVQDLNVKLFIKKTYYFGYFNNMESAKYIQFIEEGQKHVIFDPADLSDYRQKLVPYDRYCDIPVVNNVLFINVKLMHNPEAKFQFAEQLVRADG